MIALTLFFSISSPIGPALFLPLPAQTAEEETPSYQERPFDESKLGRFRSDPEFQYRRSEPRGRKLQWTRKKNIEPSFSTGMGGAGMNAIFWVLIIGLVLFILYQIVGMQSGRLRKKAKEDGVGEAEEVREDIREMDFEDLIRKAIEQGLYRLAVRLHYLGALRKLTDQELIVWTRDKTNKDYLEELKDRSLQPPFSDLTLLFEYIWYGEFPIDRGHFDTARISFLDFEQRVGGRR